MKLDFRTQRGLKSQKVVPSITRDFSKLQKTQVDQDKLDFNSFHRVKNMTHKGLNAELRPGVLKLASVTDILSIGFHERDDENALMAMVDTGTDSKLVEINRTTGAATNKITGISGDDKAYFTSLRQFLYVCNGTADIQVLNSGGTAESAVALPSSGIAKFVANDGERLWVAQTNGIVRHSAIVSGVVATANFVVSGTAISRAALVQSQIVNPTCMKSNGKLVCIASEDRIEIHSTPDFASNGITTYPDDVSTLLRSYSNLGVSSDEAIVPYANGFFVKPKDGSVYFIAPQVSRVSGGSVVTTDREEYRDNLQFMENLDWSNVSLGINLGKKLLYITGKSVANYDTTVVFNIQEENFSYFDNIWAKQWISDTDNIYYLNSFNYDIQDAFKSTYKTDNGANIDWSVETASVYGNLDNYWKAQEFFMNVAYQEDSDITAELFIDKRINGTKASDWSKTFELKEYSSPFQGGISGFGQGVFGGIEAGLGMYYTDDLESEYYEFSEKIFNVFKRASLKLSGSASNKIKIRGIGMNAIPTTRRVRNISMYS